jgi:hypothetical protein
MTALGVIADTHVPDRVRRLSERALDVFQQTGVDAILHAGDISVRAVLDRLEGVAPVIAVRGNRDWVALRHLPPKRTLNFDGITFGLAHGHGGLQRYLINRVHYVLQGYHSERFIHPMLAQFPEADVIVFGHTHRPINQRFGNRLLFNPGSPHVPEDDYAPSVGIIRVDTGGLVEAEIIWLT